MSVCGTFVFDKLIVLWGSASPLLAQPAEHAVEKFVVLVQKSDFSILSVLRIFRNVVRWGFALRSCKGETVVRSDRVLLNQFPTRNLNLQLESTSNGGASGNACKAPDNVAIETDELVLGTKRMIVRKPKGDLGAVKLDVRPKFIVLLDHFAECGSQSMALMA